MCKLSWIFAPIQQISKLTYEIIFLLSSWLVNDTPKSAASACAGLVLLFVLLFCACARDSGSFDRSRDNAHEKREFFDLVWSLRGDRKAQCSRHGCMFDLISLFLLEASLRCGFYQPHLHVGGWLATLQEQINQTHVHCAGRAACRWHSQVWIRIIGITEQILTGIFWTQNVTWNYCPGLFFVSCHLAYFQQGKKLFSKTLPPW